MNEGQVADLHGRGIRFAGYKTHGVCKQQHILIKDVSLDGKSKRRLKDSKWFRPHWVDGLSVEITLHDIFRLEDRPSDKGIATQ
jgi:hypothetical protein